ncbi:MAG: sigma-70 family RNA polymerase sigma factor [Actinomycetota bacterium]|nr:sigma-70 family RNA polymerase sigma factor [Actinomycetota bacterium]
MPARSGTPEQRFSSLYHATRSEIMAYLVRRAPTLEDAADALAETYTAAWRKLDSLPEGDQARLWLFGAARTELRIAARRERAADELITEIASELRAAHSQHIQAADTDQALWSAFSGLSALDREILTLTAWEDLTPREIATVMGMTTNLVRVRLHRARRELQTRLRSESRLETQPIPVAPEPSH